jgi:hypothetical protein
VKSTSAETRRLICRIGVGLVVAATALGCQALRDGLAPHVPFPSVPAQACEPVLNPRVPGSPPPSIAWHVSVEIDRPEGSAILFTEGSDSLLCFVSRSSGGSLGGVATASGGVRDAGPGLTLDLAMGSPNAAMQDIFTGRTPSGTAIVRLSSGNGAEDQAAVANGFYLAWLVVPAAPTEIDAFHGSDHLLQRLAQPVIP